MCEKIYATLNDYQYIQLPTRGRKPAPNVTYIFPEFGHLSEWHEAKFQVELKIPFWELLGIRFAKRILDIRRSNFKMVSSHNLFTLSRAMSFSNFIGEYESYILEKNL